MINLAISLSSGTALFFILTYLTGYYQWGIVGALALIFALNYILSKRIMRKLEDLMAQVTRELQNQRFDKAIKALKAAYPLANWQFFVKPQLQAQIGTIHYIKKEPDEAMEYLRQGFSKHWVAMGMLAILYMKKGDKDSMVKTFEKAVKATPKEGLLWSLYAYCVLKEGDRDKALEVLARGLKKLPDDDKLKANQTAVANKQRMKMKNYGEMWMQFYLEKTPPVGQKIPQYLQGLAQAQGGRRRVIRR
jgi:tetratricopeptide (TPR) repeat protein